MPDYFRFASMMLNKGELDGIRLLGRKTVELMTMNHLPDGEDLTKLALPGMFTETGCYGVGFGLGFSVMQSPASRRQLSLISTSSPSGSGSATRTSSGIAAPLIHWCSRSSLLWWRWGSAAICEQLAGSPSPFVLATTASHGLLDMLTNGGLGIALLWPFTEQRYFLPLQPIEVSPLSVSRLFSPAGLPVFTSELLYVWQPCALGAFAVDRLVRARR